MFENSANDIGSSRPRGTQDVEGAEECKNTEDPLAEGEGDEEEDEEEHSGEDDDSDAEGAGGLSEAASSTKRRPKLHAMPEAGIIKKIHVRNFMCHDNFSVNLNKNMNFIQGKNGSGKSAIFAALQICLGARAADTHRNKSLKEFITNGHPGDALVEVHLHNCHPAGWEPGLLTQAFEHDKFGDVIIVQRKIAQSGASTFTLLTQSGNDRPRVVYSPAHGAKRKVDELCEKFNIQIDNPCCLLGQEDSKRFITGTDSQKYEFFTRATGLNRVVKEYTRNKVELNEVEDKLIQHEGMLPNLKKNAEIANNKWRDAQRMGDLRLELSTLMLERAWSAVAEEEKDAAKKEAKLAKLQSNIEKVEAALAAATAAAEEKRVAKEEALAAFKKVEGSILEAQRALKATQAAKDRAEREVAAAARSVAEEAKNVERNERNYGGLQRQLEKARAEQQQRADTEEKKVLERMAAADARVHGAQAEVTGAQAAEEEASEALQAANDQLRTCEQMRDASSGRLEDARRRVAELKRHAGSQEVLFGSEVASLAAELRKHAAEFREPPLGPIGIYLSMKQGEQRWANAVEGITFNALDKFIVTSPQDEQLFRRIRGGLGIFRGSKEGLGLPVRVDAGRARLRPNQTDPNLRTVERILNPIESDGVFNYIVDTCSPERVALVDTIEEAEQWWRGGQMPQFIKEFRLRDGASTRLVGGHPRFDSAWGPARFLHRTGSSGRGAEAELQEREQEVEQLSAELRQYSQDAARLTAAATAARKTHEGAERRIKQAVTQLRKCESLKEKERLSSLQAGELVGQALDGLEEALVQTEGEIEEAKRRRAAAEQHVAELEANLPALRQAHAEAQAAFMAERNDAGDVEQAVETAHAAWLQAEKDGEVQSVKLAKGNDYLPGYLQAAQAARAEAVALGAKAQQYMEGLGPQFTRPENPRSADAMDKLIQDKTRQLRTEEARHGGADLDQLEHDMNMTAAVLDEKQVSVRWLEKRTEQLNELLRKASKRNKAVRKSVQEKVAYFFHDMMSQRNHGGTVDFVNPKREGGVGEMSIVPTVNVLSERQEEVQKLGTLSGGERSFTTLCCLLALTDSAGATPFTAFDEIDIYMDANYRKAAIELLVENARKRANKQLIVLTPHDLSDLTQAPDLSILRLKNLDGAQTRAGPRGSVHSWQSSLPFGNDQSGGGSSSQ